MDRVLDFQITGAYDSIYDFFKEIQLPKKITLQLKQNPQQVLLQNKPALLRHPLQSGDLLSLVIRETEGSSIAPVAMPLSIVYEDQDILVVDKPASLPVHPSIRHYEDTLANALMAYYEKENSPFVFRCMNRLDRDTSGLTLIAKNPFSSAMLQRQVKERGLHRTYLAIVEGSLPSSGTIDAPIGRVTDSVVERAIDYDKGQPAITHYTCLEQKNGFSLASIHLETGRTHQIRVHMTSIGHPLPGDFLYHPSSQGMTRQALHSHKLSFIHPYTKEEMNFCAPMPADMHHFFYS